MLISVSPASLFTIGGARTLDRRRHKLKVRSVVSRYKFTRVRNPLTLRVVSLVPPRAPSLEGVLKTPSLRAGAHTVLDLKRITESVEGAVAGVRVEILPRPEWVAHCIVDTPGQSPLSSSTLVG